MSPSTPMAACSGVSLIEQCSQTDSYADRSDKIDLYDYAQVMPMPATRDRPVKDDLSDWRVVDD